MGNWLGRLSTMLRKSRPVEISSGKTSVLVKDQATGLRDAVKTAQVNKNDKNFNITKNDAATFMGERSIAVDGKRTFAANGTEKQVTDSGNGIQTEPQPVIVNSRVDKMIRRKGNTDSHHIKSGPKGYEQVAGLIERIETHMDMQSQRSDRLVTLLESAFAGSDGLNVLSDIKNNNEALVSTLKEHLDKQQVRDERMSDLLTDINRTSDKHVDMLGLIHNQLDTGQKRDSEIISTLGDFRSAMSELATTNSRSIEVLTSLVQNQQEKQQELTTILQRHYKIIMIFAGMCLAVSGSGLVMATVALIRTYASAG